MIKNLSLLIIVLMAMSCNKKTNEPVKTSKKANDLIGETSPYLLQHAYNPVNWKPWGDKALELAKKENKLLVISIGYASCHWCHVMEEESFEDDSIAALMNEDFVNIKVDREERPDIDQIYMDAIQLMTGRGGWPLNVIALPDGRPVYAGTYHTKSQWKQMLVRMSELYEDKPEDLEDYATQLTKGINNYNLVPYNTEPPKFSKSLLDEGISNQMAYWDNKLGGSKQAPKFPLPNKLDFLMRYAFQEDKKEVMDYVLTTLDQMAYGGIYDQIGGGFARYSTDNEWHIPHFEKMLYDNAQLVSTYSHAYALTEKELYKQVVYETLSFVERELMSDAAAFYSSLDADSMNDKDELEEGAFYVWTKDELKTLLGEDFDLFSDYFNINAYGLWEQGHYVLIRKTDTNTFIEKNDLNTSDFQAKLKSWKNLLLLERNKKARPRLDDKILTSWNGLMLVGYIDAFKVFNEPMFLSIAEKNARFIFENLIKEDGGLYHNHKDGKSTINGYLEDYASIIKAFVGMYEVTADESWLNRAKDLSEYSVKHFLDKEKSLFYFTSNEDKKLISRKKEIFDNVIPSSNSMMAQNLFVLSHYFNHTEFRELSEQMLNNIKPQLSQSPTSFSNWYLLLADFVGPYYEIAISGKQAIEIQKEITSNYIPNSMLAISEQESDLPLMKNRFTEDDTYIFVCVDGTCKLPVKETAKAMELVGRKFENQQFP